MRISEILKHKKSFSFEVFPPKPQNSSINDIFHAIDELDAFHPDFISVTFKSSGDFAQNTIDLADYIQRKSSAEPLVHITCGALDVQEVDQLAQLMVEKELENVLALRGDKPLDFSGEYLKSFKHASELLHFLQEKYDFCLAGACYPEGHIESQSLYDDLKNLKIKQEMGAAFFITQLFYDNNYYYRLIRLARQMGITIPIIPGVMPLTSTTLFNRIMNMAGASIPFDLRVLFDRFRDDKKAMYEIGIAYSVNQILELLANDAEGIHIYSMNNPKVVYDIYSRIENVIEKELR